MGVCLLIPMCKSDWMDGFVLWPNKYVVEKSLPKCGKGHDQNKQKKCGKGGHWYFVVELNKVGGFSHSAHTMSVLLKCWTIWLNFPIFDWNILTSHMFTTSGHGSKEGKINRVKKMAIWILNDDTTMTAKVIAIMSLKPPNLEYYGTLWLCLSSYIRYNQRNIKLPTTSTPCSFLQFDPIERCDIMNLVYAPSNHLNSLFPI